jgi:hypothetical protein
MWIRYIRRRLNECYVVNKHDYTQYYGESFLTSDGLLGWIHWGGP